MRSATLFPAYGRNYRSRAEALADWEAGKDFEIVTIEGDDAYCSKRDALVLLDLGYTHLTFHTASGRTLVNVPIRA